MDALLYVLGILLAVTGIALAIGLHEIGHLVPAKRLGVKVTQYMVGFGPTLWSRQHGETEYGVKAIPLGGYIRMIGMYPPPKGAPAGSVGRGSTGRLQVLAEEARVAAWEEVAPGDEHRVFYRLSVPKRVVIMMGGPTMNLLLAVLFFSILLLGIGIPTATTTISRVYPCVPAAMASEQAARDALADPQAFQEPCPADAEPSPATEAGITPGDRIAAVDGREVSEWEQLTDITRARPGGIILLALESEGQVREVQVRLATAYRPVLAEDGTLTEEIETSGYLGVSPEGQYVAQPLSAVPTTIWDITTRSVQALVTLPVRVYDLARDMVAGEERDLESPVSVVGVGRISGEVVAADEPLKSKAAILLSLMAGLNLFLFLFNLVPLLPLDGGHVFGALWEGGRRRIAAVRGRPDPGPVDVTKALPVTYVVVVAMIIMSSVVILADVINPISLYG
jgi:membrane-associated protease RseP (regulator of RpoE activity)